MARKDDDDEDFDAVLDDDGCDDDDADDDDDDDNDDDEEEEEDDDNDSDDDDDHDDDLFTRSLYTCHLAVSPIVTHYWSQVRRSMVSTDTANDILSETAGCHRHCPLGPRNPETSSISPVDCNFPYPWARVHSSSS